MHDHDHHDHGQGEAVSHPLATLEGEVGRDEERLDDLHVGFTSYHHYDHDHVVDDQDDYVMLILSS